MEKEITRNKRGMFLNPQPATRNPQRLVLITVAAALIILGSACNVFCQDVSNDVFTGRGLAKIVDGDTAGARQVALKDAKGKVVLGAVCARLPVEDITKYFLTLNNLFFNHPDIYLQRFKIINEIALYDKYNVTIEGFVHQEQLGHDLEIMGIIGSDQIKLSILLMIAENGIGLPDKTFWWSSNGVSASSQSRVQQKLEKQFGQKGANIIDPFQSSANIFIETIGNSPAPDVESVCSPASQLGADYVVLGTASFERSASNKISSLVSIQCDISVRVIDVRSRSVIVQAAAHALGVHVDESSAILDAVEKAGSHLAEQVIEKIYIKRRRMHEYLFELTFNKPVFKTVVKGWLAELQNIVREIEPLVIEGEEKKKLWTVRINSSVESGAIFQKMLEVEWEGYKTEFVSVNDNIIKLNIFMN